MTGAHDFTEMYGQPDSFDETKLHPDLVPYMADASFGGRILRHPLVYSLPPIAWRWVNQKYERQAEEVEQALAQQEWHRAVMLHERPWRLTRLAEWWRQMDDTIERNALLLDVWADTERPFQFGRVPLDLFKQAREGRTLYLTDDDAGDRPIMTERVQVWRGTGIGEKPGIAWTLDRERAEWFAKRNRDKTFALLLGGTVKRERVLAYIVGRSENEVVVDPRHVYARTQELIR